MTCVDLGVPFEFLLDVNLQLAGVHVFLCLLIQANGIGHHRRLEAIMRLSGRSGQGRRSRIEFQACSEPPTGNTVRWSGNASSKGEVRCPGSDDLWPCLNPTCRSEERRVGKECRSRW